MAEIVIQRSALAQFMEELPGLIMQYKQLEMAQEERMLEREDRKALATQGILLKEYYDMKGQVETTEKMFDQYDNLKPSDVTQAGADIISIVDEQNNISMDAITKNLNTLSEYKSELETSLGNLKGQATNLREMHSEFAGADRVMLPHEYKAFQEHALKSLEEGGLGWETTAGADAEYFKTDATTRFAQALQMTEKMKSDHKATGKGDYAIMQGMMQLGEGDKIKDLADRLEYKDTKGNVIHRPSEGSLALLQNLVLQTDFQDFVTAVETYPSDAGGNQLRSDIASNPNLARIYQNISRNSEAMNTLDRELGGMNNLPQANRLDEFVSSIEGVTNKQALFGLYDQYTKGLDPAEHAQYFNAIELAMGGEDLGPSYLDFKGFGGGAETVPKKIELDNILQSIKEQGFPTADQVNYDIMQSRGETPIPYIDPNLDTYLDDPFGEFLEQEGIK